MRQEMLKVHEVPIRTLPNHQAKLRPGFAIATVTAQSANHSVVVTKHEGRTDRVSESAELLITIHELQQGQTRGGEACQHYGWLTRCVYRKFYLAGTASTVRSQISREISGILHSHSLADFQQNF